jgi:hypothetical protein
MTSLQSGQWLTVFIVALFTTLLASASVQARTSASVKHTSRFTVAARSGRIAHRSKGSERRVGCLPCGARAGRACKARRGKQTSAVNLPCHSKEYLDPKIRNSYRAALVDMKRARLSPKVTSYWRSSADQARLHRCSLSRRCRLNHPGLYRAMPPGKSVHEAGFAVDIAGVAAGPRGGKRITTRGRRIVAIMKRHGFNWRYGLNDPVHFEANPQSYGYKSVKQAIKRNQTVCEVKLAREEKRAGLLRVNTHTKARLARKTNQEKRLRAEASSAKTRRQASRSSA